MCFAGFWEMRKGEDEIIKSCAILTCGPNDMMAQLHNRMPVILDPKQFDWWMTGKTKSAEASFPEEGPVALRTHPRAPPSAGDLPALGTSRITSRSMRKAGLCVGVLLIAVVECLLDRAAGEVVLCEEAIVAVVVRLHELHAALFALRHFHCDDRSVRRDHRLRFETADER